MHLSLGGDKLKGRQFKISNRSLKEFDKKLNLDNVISMMYLKVIGIIANSDNKENCVKKKQ